jgi:hypothetical protein
MLIQTDQTLDFLRLVLPWDGASYGNLHWTTDKLNPVTGKPYWGGRANTTPEELQGNLSWAMQQASTRDIYFCLSSQAVAEEKQSKFGRKFTVPHRSQQNAVRLRSVWIDVDVKPGAYEDRTQAVQAVAAFYKAVDLPPPSAVVASGSGGLHVYWAFVEALAPAAWQVLANALANATQAKGLHCDTQCTVDSARILRVPGTRNYKSDPPNPVELLVMGAPVLYDAMERALEPFKGVIPPTSQVAALPPRTGPAGANDDLGGGIESIKLRLSDVVRGCPFIADAVAGGGDGYSEPLWTQTVYLSMFLHEGREAAHLMSKGDPRYTPEGVDAKFDEQVAKRRLKNMGWTSCAKIAQLGCTQCAVCPNRAAGKSPLSFGLPQLPTFTPDLLPDGYVRADSGAICKQVMDEDGMPVSVIICPYPMDDPWLQDNPWTLHFTSRTSTGRKANVSVALEQIATKDGCVKVFAKQGLMLPESRVKLVREFLVSWIQKLQENKEAVVSSTPFGWSVVNGKIEGFTYGGTVLMKGGAERQAAIPDPVIESQYMPRGELTPWVEAAKVVTDQKRPALEAILAVAFGGPLVRFTGEPGALLHAYSPESGIGKTTVMRIAQAVWGDPYRAMQSLNDTTNSVLNKIGMLRELPIFWDEIKSEEDTKRFALLAFQLTEGREKLRMGRDLTIREAGSWQTILCSASNASVLDAVTANTKGTNAGIYRVIEFKVPPGGRVADASVARRVQLLRDNFGHPGLVYAKYLGENYEQVAKEVATFQDKITRLLQGQQDERFWFVLITCVVMGAHYANKLGLTEFDIPTLRDHMINSLKVMRGEIKDSTHVDLTKAESVVTVLAQYLTAMDARHTLRTNRVNVSRGKPAVGVFKIESDCARLDGIYVQIGREDGIMRISSTHFSNWCEEHGYSRNAMIKTLREHYGVKYTNGVLGSGTERSKKVVEYLLEVDTNAAAFKGLFE